MTCARIGGVVVATVCLAAVLHAEQDALEFEVVSLRRSATMPSTMFGVPSPRGEFSVLANGRLEVRGETLANLAAVAFGFDAGTSKGVVHVTADWMLKDGFDLTAAAGEAWTTPPPGTTIPAELRAMLRALLEDRFAMQTRIATKQVSVTALRVARKEKLGPHLRPSIAECREPEAEAVRDEGTPAGRCPVTITQGEIQAQAVTMTEVTQLIAQHPAFRGRFLFVDQTGLAGLYDLSFSTRRGGRSIDGMIEEQLGLSLRPTHVPLPSLIIERARTPQLD